MPHADFVHLRVHDAFSLSEGAIKIPDLVALCVDGGMPAVGVADTGNLFGALEFSLAARDAGVQPVLGVEPDDVCLGTYAEPEAIFPTEENGYPEIEGVELYVAKSKAASSQRASSCSSTTRRSRRTARRTAAA